MPRTITLFGQDFMLKDVHCSRGHYRGHPAPPLVTLYVKTTDACNAHCLFCSNGGPKADTAPFDKDRFFDIVDAILSHEELQLGSIRFTGGEPSVVAGQVVIPLLDRLGSEPYKSLFLHLNTNALSVKARRLMQHPRWNSISVSMHHYDRQRLSQIYGVKVEEDIDLHPFIRNGLKLNFSCNLIRGYIDSAAEAKLMMDYAIDRGASTLGFVSLMKLNDYCRQHFVDYTEIDWESIPSLYLSHQMDRGTDCRCRDYLYNHNGQALMVYMRNNLNPDYCESSLLFDGQHLQQGFYKNSHSWIF